MSDVEYGPDPNQVRRHAKKMLTELEYRKKYRRIDFWKPHPKQMEFHNLVANERMLRAGNQLGKTQCLAAQKAMDALSLYPDWYTGRRFVTPPPIERAYDWIGWAGCTTSVTTRDGIQFKLCGDLSQSDGLGQGMIPLDNFIGRPTMARGISDFADHITLRRETGGTAAIYLKTFEMDRKAWQGQSVDEIWIDEDPSDDVIYGECLARLTATQGQIIVSMTPVLGRTAIRKRFAEGAPGRAEIVMGLDDALHISKSEHATILSRYKASERSTRAYGADMQGAGAVFEIGEDLIRETLDPATIPEHWSWLWALDFGHGGMSSSSHPFAAVLGAWDRDTDCIHIVHAFRMRQALPLQHVAAIREHPCASARVAWPHDGGATGFASTDTIAATYKKLGLRMLPTHATFKTGGYSFEAGISEMENRFANGKLKVAAHLSDWWDEYRNYHRVEGLVHKVDDDLMSATRVLCMDIRHAKTLSSDDSPFERMHRRGKTQFAEGLDFDIFR
jgi:phage terminase large subunit-like protein